MAGVISIRREILGCLLEQARRDPTQECCGLLAGRGDVITKAFPAPNALQSDTAFEIAPAELFRIFRAMRAKGLAHLGIYHSHPVGDNTPSARDIARAYYPDVAYVIVSPREDAAHPVRAFRIREGRAGELRIQEE
jgi:proteasome lid subunit RPN8/RPN11